jgi:hypothetical protein
LSIELRANYRITEKSIGLEGIEPADGITACDNLADDLGKSQPQSSIKPKKVSVLRGLSPPMALSLAIIWLTISANRSLNQASSKQFVMSTQAYAIF